MRLLIARQQDRNLHGAWGRPYTQSDYLPVIAQMVERSTVEVIVIDWSSVRIRFTGISRDGAGEARKAHNLEVDGSKPSLAL